MCYNLFYSRILKSAFYRGTYEPSSEAGRGEGAHEGALKRGKVLVNNGNNDDGVGKVRATGT